MPVVAGHTVPNFRIPKRLISWMQVNGIRERVPSAEKVFFKDNPETVQVRAWGLVNYAKLVGPLPEEMEDLISKCPNACVGYIAAVAPHAPQKIVEACGEDPVFIIKMSGVLHRRMVKFEDKITTPAEYVSYATGVGQRMPQMEERILFCETHPNDHRANAAFELVKNLSNDYGPFHPESPALDQRIKDLIKLDAGAVAKYMDYLRQRNMKLEPEFWVCFSGSGLRLAKLAEHIRARLPEDLEATWQGGTAELVQYATRWVRTRLPEDLEKILIGDHKSAALYAQQVVRGFADLRLSDSLHTFMVMKSFELPDDYEIKRYIQECDRLAEIRKVAESK